MVAKNMALYIESPKMRLDSLAAMSPATDDIVTANTKAGDKVRVNP